MREQSTDHKAAVAILALGLSAVLAVMPFTGALADEGHGKEAEAPKSTMEMGNDAGHSPMTGMMGMPEMNAERGMTLFAEKGCVTCHSINGVGGHDATPLDAHSMEPMMNPFEFAAKMWTMAPYMIAAQEEAFGEQIQFTGDELSNIVAFVHDDAQQHKFNDSMLSGRVRKMMDHGHGAAAPAPHADEIGHMK